MKHPTQREPSLRSRDRAEGSPPYEGAGIATAERPAPDIERCRRLIEAYLAPRVRHARDREDLVQEVLMQAAAALPAYRGQGTLSAWVLGIAANMLKNYINRTLPGYARQTSLSDVPEPSLPESTAPNLEASVVERTFVEELRAAIDAACTEEESLVLRYMFHGDTSPEIALLLGMPEGTVRSHMKRGREKTLAYIFRHRPDLVAGQEALEAAYRASQNAPDPAARLSSEEERGWQAPDRYPKAFRAACRKVAAFLALPLLPLALILRGGLG